MLVINHFFYYCITFIACFNSFYDINQTVGFWSNQQYKVNMVLF